MAAKGFWKLLGFKQKDIVTNEKENTPVETVVVENDGAVKIFRAKKVLLKVRIPHPCDH